MCCHDRHIHHPCCCQPCECGRPFTRRFQTKQERIEELQEYLRQLKAEIQAVEEQLTELSA